MISAVKGLMILCALSFEHVFKSLFFFSGENSLFVKNAKDKRSFWTERRGERGVLVKKVKLVSYHVVHLDYYIGQN